MLRFLKAFGYAATGLVVFFRHEKNGKIQAAIALLVVVLGVALHVSRVDWMWLSACIALVLALEMMNSAIEKICNLVHPNFHPAVKIVKDMSAGAVLWISVFSAVIGVLIFLPKIVHLF